MIIFGQDKARNYETLKNKRSNGLSNKDVVRASRYQSCTPNYNISHERMREQQRCRDYWQRRYGAEAERASRGGTTWLV